MGVFVAGALLRSLASFAFRPAILYHADSYTYIERAISLTPDPVRPVGYSFFLLLLGDPPNLTGVVAMQDVIGLGLGLLIYLASLRIGAPRWAGAVAAAIFLLDPYQVDIEQFILSETFTEVLLVGGLCTLFWRRAPSAPRALLAGALLGLAVTGRLVAVAAIAAALLCLVVWRGWRITLACLVGAAIPLLAYASWYYSYTGQFGLQTLDGYAWYGRVSTFATCDGITLSRYEQELCFRLPTAVRPSPNWYSWAKGSPVRVLPPSVNSNTVAEHFSWRMILDEPLPYLKTTGEELAHFFGPGHPVGLHSAQIATWQFSPSYASLAQAQHQGLRFDGYPSVGHIDKPIARLLRSYQRWIYLPGPVLGALIFLGLVGAIAGKGRRQRAAAALAALSCLGLLVLPAATVIFDYRYEVPAEPLAAMAGLAGTLALVLAVQERRLSQGKQATSGTATANDARSQSLLSNSHRA